MVFTDGLEVLSEDECRALLSRADVGRLAITLSALPAIFPVNYRVIDGWIVFRTAPGSKRKGSPATRRCPSTWMASG